MNLAGILREHAVARPRQPALCEATGAIDFATLADRVARGASLLRRAGIEAGDRMLVFHPVAIPLYEVLLAAFHAGVTIVLADPSGGRAFLDAACRRTRPKAFFGSHKAHLLRVMVPAIGRIPIAFHSSGWSPLSRSWERLTREGAVPLCEVDDTHPALITFTSGSTGVPKAALRTHGFLLAQHAAIAQALGLRPGECDLITLPVFALANLASGVTSVLADCDLGRPAEAQPERIRRQSARWDPKRCAASPAFFEALLRQPDGLPEFDSVFTGGAPVFPDLMDRLAAARPGVRVVAVYGSTEAEPIAEIDLAKLGPAERERTAGGGGLPAGPPVQGLDVAILPDCWGRPIRPLTAEAFDALRLETDRAGEIVVSGPQVLPGYLDSLGDEETKLRVGDRIWHRTGDAGCLDAAGRLWLLGRCAAKHLRGDGKTIYPFSIEAAARVRFPGLKCAAISLSGSLTLVAEGDMPEGLDAFAHAMDCDDLRSIPRLPMDRRHQAKIDYPALRATLAKYGNHG